MSRDVGIDLGTTNVVIHLRGRGVVLNEPAMVAVNKSDGELVAVGQNALDMLGRNPSSVEVIQPLKGGVVVDFEATERLLSYYLGRILNDSMFKRPNILLLSPAQISEVERSALLEVCQKTTSGVIYLEAEPLVAALGAGIDIMDSKSHMLIDIGGGTTDIAVIANGTMLAKRTIKVAGDSFDEAILQYFKVQKNLLIGIRSARDIKESVGSAKQVSQAELKTDILNGRNLITGLPDSMNVDSNHIQEALEAPLKLIARSARELLQDLPPEVSADILERGITLTGGGSLLYHLDTYLSQELEVSVLRAQQPMMCVAIGSGLLLEMIEDGTYGNVSTVKKRRSLRQWFNQLRRRLFG